MRPCCASTAPASSAALLVGLSRRAARRGAIPREVAAPRRMEGHAVQHLLRRHLQRAAPAVGAALRLAPAGLLPQMKFVKAHALGNDFLLLDDADVPKVPDRPALTRALCERHRGIGADGVIFYSATHRRCRDAAPQRRRQPIGSLRQRRAVPRRGAGRTRPCTGRFVIDHSHRCRAQRRSASRQSTDRALPFAPRWALPERVEQRTLDVDGAQVEAVSPSRRQPAMRRPRRGDSEARLHGMAARLAVHPGISRRLERRAGDGRRAPARVRILIWERGVGPTEASGTGACAAAVAAIAFGGASRDVQVASPGRHAARGVARRRALSDRLGRSHREGRWRL